MKKKGVAIAFNTIIIAAIALVVLAIIMYLLISRTAIFQRSVGDCEAKGGICQKTVCSGDKYPILAFKGCYEGGKYNESFYCCVGAG